MEKRTHITAVAIFGGADIDSHHPVYQQAYDISAYLASRGKTVVNGGGPGVMDAATQGAKSQGGKTLAVTFYPKDMPEFEGRFHENNVDEEIKTDNYIDRMFGLMEHSDLVVCFQGGTGTLSEWATAWLLAHLYYGNHKPLILYGAFWQELMDVVKKHFFIGSKEEAIYRIVTTKEEFAVALREFEDELAAR